MPGMSFKCGSITILLRRQKGEEKKSTHKQTGFVIPMHNSYFVCCNHKYALWLFYFLGVPCDLKVEGSIFTRRLVPWHHEVGSDCVFAKDSTFRSKSRGYFGGNLKN